MESTSDSISKVSDILDPVPIKENSAPKEEESDAIPASTKADSTKPSKRFIPEHKKHDAALTFPEKLMSMLQFADTQDHEKFCVAWLPDGKSFVIRNPDEFTRNVVPKYFKATKFSSFTRKLYRWGFRQVNRGIGPDDPIIFGNDNFQRDNLELMKEMRSITAASARKQEENSLHMLTQKRALESIETEQSAKRMLLMNQFMKQKSAFNNMFPNSGNMNLSQAMMGNMGGMGPMGGMGNMNMGNMNMGNNNFGMMNQFAGQSNFMNSFPQNAFNSYNGNQNGQGNSNPSSTADIVNAAINALRYAP